MEKVNLIEFTAEQAEFLKSQASVYRSEWEELVFIPTVFKRDPESDEAIFEPIPLEKTEPDFLHRVGLFTLADMKACALAMANWGEGYENALTPNEYFKQVLGIDISKR